MIWAIRKGLPYKGLSYPYVTLLQMALHTTTMFNALFIAIFVPSLLCFSVVLTLSYNSTTGTEFYVGQPLTVRCKHSQLQESDTVIMSLSREVIFRMRCLRDFDKWEVAPSGSLPDGVVYKALTDDDCDLPNKEQTLSVHFNITAGLKNVNITCYDRETQSYANSSLVIKETKCEYAFLIIIPQNFVIKKYSKDTLDRPSKIKLMSKT